MAKTQTAKTKTAKGETDQQSRLQFADAPKQTDKLADQPIKRRRRRRAKPSSLNQLELDFGLASSYEGYSTEQVAEITGATKRQVDHWTSEELVTAAIDKGSGSGSTRWYSYENLLEIKVIQKLKQSGQSLPQIKENFQYVRDKLKIDVHNSILILADGQPVAVVGEEEFIALASDVTKGSGQGILSLTAISLPQIKKQVDIQVREMGMLPEDSPKS